MSRVLIGVGVLLFALQVSFFVSLRVGGGRIGIEDLNGPVTDTLFPTTSIQSVYDTTTFALRDLLLRPSGCSIVVFANVNCGVCRRTRYTWLERFSTWVDSTGAVVHPIWLFNNEPSQVIEFVDGFDFGGIQLGLLLDKTSPLDLFGVIGTPSAYIVDGAGRMRLGVAGDRLPPPHVVEQLCKD